MYNSPDYEALLSVARTYAEGFKEFPADKVKAKEAKTKDPGRKRDMMAARLAHTDPDLKGIAQDAVKGQEKENRLTGQKKALGRAYDNSGEGANKERASLQRKAAEQALKAKPKRPRTRMPKHNMKGTIKK